MIRCIFLRLHAGNLGLSDLPPDFSVGAILLKTCAIDRYFFRRLAIARRKAFVSLSGPYHEALAEVILVFLALPAAGLLSFVGLSTMKWWG